MGSRFILGTGALAVALALGSTSAQACELPQPWGTVPPALPTWSPVVAPAVDPVATPDPATPPARAAPYRYSYRYYDYVQKQAADACRTDQAFGPRGLRYLSTIRRADPRVSSYSNYPLMRAGY